MTGRLVDRAATAVERLESRLTRRRFLTRTAVVGSALVAAPTDLLLRPRSAYAAVCGCGGRTCDCGSLCCDGYTEFCCAIHGLNACPRNAVAGGWWKADGSGFCGGSARYYLDCHRRCGTCSCGGSGICSGACSNTGCGCANGRCDHRKAGCTHFRYGNCGNHIRCLGPIVCRVVTCTPPWQTDSTCSTASRTDNFTRSHNRPCLQHSGVYPVTGDWNGDGTTGIGIYSNDSALWQLRQRPSGGAPDITFEFGHEPGDLPVVGDWDGDGSDSVAIYRPSEGGHWYVKNRFVQGPSAIELDFGQKPGDIPVAGDWDGDGRDGPGIYRPSEDGRWYLKNRFAEGRSAIVFQFGRQPGDVPVVGDWDGDGRDGVGIYRPSEGGRWYLKNDLVEGRAPIVFEFGRERGDIPVVGDWDGDGRDGVGFYRPSEGTWYLKNVLANGRAQLEVRYGPVWNVG